MSPRRGYQLHAAGRSRGPASLLAAPARPTLTALSLEVPEEWRVDRPHHCLAAELLLLFYEDLAECGVKRLSNL